MKRSTFNLLFYVKKGQPKRNGSCPVMGRITVDGAAVQFSCKFDVDPKIWDAEAGRACGRSESARQANRLLDRIGTSLTEHYREIVNRDGYVTAEKVKNAWLGMDARCETLLKVYERHNEDFEKMYRSGSRSKSTRDKYLNVYRLLREFIRHRYRRSDLALKEIQYAFITDFELFLRTEKGIGTTTVWMYMMPLRKMIATAMHNGWLSRDPFFGYNIAPDTPERGFLTKEEIRTLMEYKCANRSEKKCAERELVRDLFIFCVFTGFSYSDLRSMSAADLQDSFDERHRRIVKQRDKTKVTSTVPLLDIPRKILEKYRDKADGDRLLPVPTYRKAQYLLARVEQSAD